MALAIGCHNGATCKTFSVESAHRRPLLDKPWTRLQGLLNVGARLEMARAGELDVAFTHDQNAT